MLKRKKLIILEDENINDTKIKLSEPKKEDSIESYVQLAKVLSSDSIESIDDILNVLNRSSFIEDNDVMYRGMPVEVYYRQLPIVYNDEIKVKLVLLVQADSLALIIPEHVSEVYQELKEDPELLIEKNKDISLYAEIYSFDSKDSKLYDLIKSTYLTAGNSLKAFELPVDVKKDNNENGEEDEFNSEESFGGDFSNSDFNPEDTFGAIDEPVEELPDLEENIKSYKKFKNQTKALDKLVEMMYNKIDDNLKEDIKIKYLTKDRAILVLEVNNKSIYRKYSRVTKVAKKIMTNIGESIRLNKSTQMLDSFIKNGKRYFIVAEDINNNFWITKEDKLETITEGKYIDPIQEEIIILNRSSIRKEARKLKPYKKENKIIYRR